jgi:RNA polymerase sigma-70 factor (ECF subfamily)
VVEDADLIGRSLDGDGGAFEALFHRHYAEIHRFLRARVGPDAADDLAAETFTTAFRRRGDYDLGIREARPWLYGIAVNLLRAHRRTEQRWLRGRAHLAWAELAASEPGIGSATAEALLALTVDERNLILLYAWADLSYEQLGAVLDVPVGTIRSRLNRTRLKLRVLLGAAKPAALAEADR